MLHRGAHAVYVDVHGWCVGVLDTSAAQVPCALVARDEDFVTLSGASAYLNDGVLYVDDIPLAVGRFTSVAVPRIRVTPPHFPRVDTEPLPPPLDPEHVARLVGAGGGLTPYGDDVLCGWLAIHRAAQVPTPAIDEAVLSLLDRTTLLSATLLECAVLGEVLPEFAAYVTALGTGGAAASVDALTAIGHTSGTGLLSGARWALADLRTTIGVAA